MRGMNNFWEKIDKPISALAPMAGFTDFSFRKICADFGADVVYSEMANVTALTYQPAKTLEMLGPRHKKSYYVVQLFGSNVDHFKKAIKVVEKEIRPDGIDINFGCPVPKVMKVKAGAELMKDLDLSYKVIKTSIEASKLPISVKVRTKVGKITALDFIEKVKDLDIKAIMVHGRTFSQGFSGDIDCDMIQKIKNTFKGIVLANGGINDKERALEILRETGADGLGIARGALGHPWLFSQIKGDRKDYDNYKIISKAMIKHAKLVYKNKGDRGILEIRKHLPWYIQNMTGAKKIREKLVRVKTIEDVKKSLKPPFFIQKLF